MMKNPSFITIIILLLIQAFLFFKKEILIKPEVSIYGYILMSDGLGRQSAELLDLYLKHSIDVSFIKTRGSHFTDTPKSIIPLIKNKNKRVPGSIIIYEEALFNEPKILKEQLKRSSKEDIRLAYTMFESSKIPKNFVSNLNLYFDAAIVPDSYHIKVYQNCGVKIPIFVLPLGLDISNFLKAPIKRGKNKPFIFANFSSCCKRKNHSVLIQAFAKAFKDNPDVLLKIRSRCVQDGLDITLTSLIDSLKAGNIEFSIRAPNNQEYLKEFIDCDCYVSLSKGEGFSIQPREAMALGIPSIVSSNTAQKTICESGLVKSVQSNIEEKADISMYQEDLGCQYNCDIDEVASALIEMYDNYDVYLEKSDLARLWSQQYLYKNLEDHYLCLIGKKKISLGTENLICDKELITNSKTLYKKYQRIKAQNSLAL